MLNTTDLVILGIFLWALWDGWRIGFLRSVLTPVCLLPVSLIALINFDLDHNIATAALIIVAGTTGLSMFLRLMIIFLRRQIDADYRHYIPVISRLLGLIASVLWKGTLVTISILFITILPLDPNNNLAQTQKNILSSQAFAIIQKDILPLKPDVQNIYLALNVLKDPVGMEFLRETPEYKDFFNAPKVQALLADDSLDVFIKAHRYELILTHPKIKALLLDDSAMKALMRLGQRVYHERTGTAENEASK